MPGCRLQMHDQVVDAEAIHSEAEVVDEYVVPVGIHFGRRHGEESRVRTPIRIYTIVSTQSMISERYFNQFVFHRKRQPIRTLRNQRKSRNSVLRAPHARAKKYLTISYIIQPLHVAFVPQIHDKCFSHEAGQRPQFTKMKTFHVGYNFQPQTPFKMGNACFVPPYDFNKANKTNVQTLNNSKVLYRNDIAPNA